MDLIHFVTVAGRTINKEDLALCSTEELRGVLTFTEKFKDALSANVVETVTNTNTSSCKAPLP